MAKVALLIGVSKYGTDFTPLPSAIRDVEAMYDVLVHPHIGGFAESNIHILKDPEQKSLAIAIENLFSSRDKDDLLLLYFSGHSIKDYLNNTLYLAACDTIKQPKKGELMRATAVSAKFIHERMSESRCRHQVIILDSCFSGAFATGLPIKGNDDIRGDIEQQFGAEGRVVLTSSSSTQYSFEQEGEDLSIYTRFFIEGIKSGEADFDQDGYISTDEIHEYASRKVRQLRPEMNPEIYVARQGYKIRLTQVLPPPPGEVYRREVMQYVDRGETSIIGRIILNRLRDTLRLDNFEAQQIEDEVLEPCRKEFRKKIDEYKQGFIDQLRRDKTITPKARQELQNLQQYLRLRNEDTRLIEDEVNAQLKDYQEKLEIYKQDFTITLRQEYPLTPASRERLGELQKQLKLVDEDIVMIEDTITAEVKAYHQKLQEYKQLFITSIKQEYPLTQEKRAALYQERERLGLTSEDVTRIEEEITTERETQYHKLGEYKQAFSELIKFEHPLSDDGRKELKRLQKILGLNDEEISALEASIISSLEERTEPTNQQQTSTKSTIRQKITRRKVLKWVGFGGVGLGTVVVAHEIFKGQSPTPLIPIQFATVTVDNKGDIVTQANKQAKLFKQDLGNGITLDMVEIIGGSFNMGSPPSETGRTQNEEPMHIVNVPTFFIGKFAVTQEQYKQIMGTTPSGFKGEKGVIEPKHPVEQVSWNDAVEFCKKLSQKVGRKYRLPSEAEWEYACRAGTTTPFHFGDTITTELANYNGDFTYASELKGKNPQHTTEVGSFRFSNAFGLYDMHGNVWEWCQDTWHDSYKGAPNDGSAWINNEDQRRCLRGGSWFNKPKDCRSAFRFSYSPDNRYNRIGFRVVCEVGRIL
ncbi:caspase, EACC1-associated type [Nostoc sp. FACHB-110]|uniref:caspase, EACC1-associated type n=1 Tax=Nostoc sp. FACHB-110 TaxID=2692834 RepID=UPI0016844FC5|nr:SUMF1/EgtB/PvdO family nonheme iron enzyme [Nostoc sp. FACHB-110]MBD2440978.1 SUMF1/EgtB/PvdO family nonheme iron enzyme [Nostoc sp. FACHB-110]